MNFDLNLIERKFDADGFKIESKTSNSISILLRNNLVLKFINHENSNESCFGFDGTEWHCHANIQFLDANFISKDIQYDEISTLLKSGELLICERWNGGKLFDRYLIHGVFNDEIQHIESNQELRIYRSEGTKF